MSSQPDAHTLTPAPRHPIDPETPRPVVLVRSIARSLPAPLTSLVGRDAEVAAARAMLTSDGVRLLTLTGPGGVGKTRLALQIANEVAPAFADGVVFVSLAPIVDPDLVLPAIARELGFREGAAQSAAELLANRLRHRRLLLVLDNVEQVVAAAPHVATLLECCSELTVLATSRTRLHLSGEHRFPVSPLALPAASARAGAPPLAAVAGSPAVQLFVERARAIEPDFILNDADAPSVAAICRRLDGLPLAIELAAARIGSLSPAELLARLEPALPLLTDGPADAPDRLRTMRNAIAWSVDRLTAAERSLFCCLSVFVDGFTLEAAESIGETEDGGRKTEGGSRNLPSSVLPPPSSLSPHHPNTPTPSPDTLHLVASLVDQSLVQRAEQPGEPVRYRMLETIRAYALSELAASGMEASARDRHAAWCLAFAERAEPELSGPRQKAWFARMEAEHPNMRAALHWHLTRNDAEHGLRLASVLNWFWSSRSYFREARQWLEGFLARPASAATRGRGLLETANILHWLGDHAQAFRYADESLAIFRDEGDAFLAMCALRRLGSIAIDRQDFARAEHLLAESRALLHAVPPPWDPRWDAAFATFLSGRLATASGRHDEALAHFAEAITAFDEVGDRGYVAAALGLQGNEWLRKGDVASARRAYATSIELAIDLGDRTWVAWAMVGAAQLAHGAGDGAMAMRLLGAAAAMRDAIGERRLPASALTPDLQATVESNRFAREWVLGTRMAEEDAIPLARAVLALEESQSGGRLALPILTVRERDVLLLLADGLGDKAIAEKLGISRRTASQHVAAILTKLEAESRTAAVTRALRHGLLGDSIPEGI